MGIIKPPVRGCNDDSLGKTWVQHWAIRHRQLGFSQIQEGSAKPFWIPERINSILFMFSVNVEKIHYGIPVFRDWVFLLCMATINRDVDWNRSLWDWLMTQGRRSTALTDSCGTRLTAWPGLPGVVSKSGRTEGLPSVTQARPVCMRNPQSSFPGLDQMELDHRMARLFQNIQ